MSKQETNPQDNAFPQENNFTIEFGLTKREYFAAMALQGLLASYGNIIPDKHTCELISRASVKYSDALIAALNEKEGLYE